MSNGPSESPSISLPGTILEKMILHAQREAPRECVGLLAGQGDTVSAIHELVNEAASMDEFHVEQGLFEPVKGIRDAGMDLVGIYHSHPNAPALPSKKDLERNYYGDIIHFIVSLADTHPVVRAFQFHESSAVEVRMIVQQTP